MPELTPQEPPSPPLLPAAFWSCAVGSIVLLIVAVIVGSASLEEGSSTGLRVGLGLLAMAAVLDAGRQHLGRRFPVSHAAHHEPARWRLGLSVVAVVVLTIVLLIDPWIAAPLFALLGLALDLLW